MARFTPNRAAIALVAFVLLYLGLAIGAPKSYGLSLFGNGSQALLQALAAFLFWRNAQRERGHRRLFWLLWCGGALLWLGAQFQWIYYENILRIEPPTVSVFDILLFIHVIPMLAATALQPHADAREEEHRLHLGYLDFSLLLVWWVFLYAYLVSAHIFTGQMELFSSRLNHLYAIENGTVIVALAWLWARTRGPWRPAYTHLLFATATYCFTSLVINTAIDAAGYYTGSLFDVPLVVSMCWFVYAATRAPASDTVTEAPLISPNREAFLRARLAAIAVLSLPVFAIVSLVQSAGSARADAYRLLVTFLTMALMMAILFVKQRTLDRTLLGLLEQSRQSYDSVRRLQGHMLHAEKLASIGRLVAGAAHEINNPLTAIVGYADLLVGDRHVQGQDREFAEKILMQARRTRNLVSNLLTFAHQGPGKHVEVNLNALTEKALRFQELGPGRKNVSVVRRLDPRLGAITGDENQLLQVFMHVVNGAVDRLLEHGSTGTIVIETREHGADIVWSCSDNGPPLRLGSALANDPGLNASTTIVAQHDGRIACSNLPVGGACVEIVLPARRVEVEMPAAVTVEAV